MSLEKVNCSSLKKGSPADDHVEPKVGLAMQPTRNILDEETAQLQITPQKCVSHGKFDTRLLICTLSHHTSMAFIDSSRWSPQPVLAFMYLCNALDKKIWGTQRLIIWEMT
jgi:hypothetical protein